MRVSKENRVLLDNTLGEYLRDLRINHNYTQKEMSDIIKLSASMLAYIENGERMPTMQTLLDYASHFSIDIKKLLEQRIITITKTVEVHGDKTPHHIMTEYQLIAYYTLLT